VLGISVIFSRHSDFVDFSQAISFTSKPDQRQSDWVYIVQCTVYTCLQKGQEISSPKCSDP
jgi:hypothetical protein